MQLVVSDIETIEELASLGHTIKEIAIILDVKPSLFNFCCLDETHAAYKAYTLGKLEADRQKNEILLEKTLTSETAIQIHDKKAKEQAFSDMKDDIYSSF